MDPILIAALYRFAPVSDVQNFRHAVELVCLQNNILGTLLIATEGINGTIAGTRPAIENLLTFLNTQPGFENIQPREATAPDAPFNKLKVRIKKEIVTFGVDGLDPRREVGTYLNPEQWNELLSQPETLVIDTRNDYEVEIGHFEGAIDPKTTSFREFVEFVDNNLDPEDERPIAMYCTGGIRCEKATAFMLQRGFKNVYHLEGGILRYLEETPEDQSRWQGECFVFDHRRAVSASDLRQPKDAPPKN